MTTPENADFSGSSEKQFVAGFLRGYRAWVREPNASLKLRSTSMVKYFWKSGTNVADCHKLRDLEEALAKTERCECGSDTCSGNVSFGFPRIYSRTQLLLEYQKLLGHETPSMNGACNFCGFYALHAPNLSPLRLSAYMTGEPDVYGSIKATGKVVVGELGFRAQYAEIEAIAGPEGEEYAKYYGVPWFPDGLDALTKALPPTRLEGVNYEPVAEPTQLSFPFGGGLGINVVWNAATGTWDIVSQRSPRPRINTSLVAAPVQVQPVAPVPVDTPVAEPEPAPPPGDSAAPDRREPPVSTGLWKRFPRLDPRHWLWGVKLDDE